jgi:hypothetical protein
VKMEEDRSGNVSLPLDIGVDPRAHVQSVHPRGNMTFAAHRNGRAIGCSINCESMQHGKGKESSRVGSTLAVMLGRSGFLRRP